MSFLYLHFGATAGNPLYFNFLFWVGLSAKRLLLSLFSLLDGRCLATSMRGKHGSTSIFVLRRRFGRASGGSCSCSQQSAGAEQALIKSAR